MTRLIVFMAALVLTGAASAQGFVDEPTCYSWNGGNFSAGSFTKCHHDVIAQAKPAPLPPPVQPSPVMMPQSAPITCAPPPKPIATKHKYKPKPVCK
jgi:hypothetical protein